MPLPVPPPGIQESLERFQIQRHWERLYRNWKANHLAGFSKSVRLSFTTFQDVGSWKLDIGRVPVIGLGVNELEN